MNVVGSVGLALLGASVQVESKRIVFDVNWTELELRVLAEHSMGTSVPHRACHMCEIEAGLIKKKWTGR